jgi:hypothetical protein
LSPNRPLWPFVSTLVLAILLAAFATTGFRQVFVQEVLGGAFDSQAEHFLRGNVDVDGNAIRHESIIVNGKPRMYFGPFPALLRIPLNFVYPAGRGLWPRLSGLCAAIIALASFAALMADALEACQLSLRSRRWFGSTCVAGLAFGSPLLLLLGNLSIYNEAIIWGFACSLAALFFMNRARAAVGSASAWWFFGFSIFAGAALLSRATFGLPFLLIAPAFVFPAMGKNGFRSLAAIALPLGAALIFYLLLSHARFGTWSGTSYEHYINPVHREFAKNHGVFSLSRIPFGLADYFSLRFPKFQSNPPFLHAERPPVPYSPFYSLPVSETYLSIVWCSSWLLLGAIIGVGYLFQRDRSDFFKRWTAAAFFVEGLLIASHFSLAERYATELYPFLVFCFLVFLSAGSSAPVRLRYTIGVLAILSIAINSMTTISWLTGADQNVPMQTREAWKEILGAAER